MKERIGIAGLGRMGSAMARRLSTQGYSVTGWRRGGVSPVQAAELGIRRRLS